jgi:hypothetical protein
MIRISQSSSAPWILASACFALGFGCHVIAGVEDRELTSGSGGMTSSGTVDTSATGNSAIATSGTMSSGSTGAGSGATGSSGGGIPDFPCTMGPIDEPNCNTLPPADCTPPNMIPPLCHCGGCNIQCGFGGSCDSGICKPKPLIQSPNTLIYRATVNAGAVYFSTLSNPGNTSNIRVVSFDGKNTPPPLNDVAIDGKVSAIDADCTNVYYSTVANEGSGVQALWSIPRTGGTPQQVPKPADGDVGESESIVHNARHVFWTDGRGVGIWEIGNDTASNRLFTAEDYFNAVGLAGDGSELYWTEIRDNDSESHLHRATINPDGSAIVDKEFMSYPGSLRHIAIDAANIYMLAKDAAAVWTVRYVVRGNLMNATSTSLTSPPSGHNLGEAIVADNSDDYVYFLVESNGVVGTRRVKKPGIMGNDIEIPTPLFNERWLVGGPKRLYLITPNNGNFGQIDWVGR